MWGRRLKGIEAIIERQQSVAAEGQRKSFFPGGENGGTRFLRSHWCIAYAVALAPLRNRLGIDAVGPAKRRDRSWRLSSFAGKRLPDGGSLYCCSDSVRCRGAAVKYLAHSASL